MASPARVNIGGDMRYLSSFLRIGHDRDFICFAGRFLSSFLSMVSGLWGAMFAALLGSGLPADSLTHHLLVGYYATCCAKIFVLPWFVPITEWKWPGYCLLGCGAAELILTATVAVHHLAFFVTAATPPGLICLTVLFSCFPFATLLAGLAGLGGAPQAKSRPLTLGHHDLSHWNGGSRDPAATGVRENNPD
jgi:hypothetical protein